MKEKPTNAPEHPGFFPLPVAAKWMGVSPRTLKRWMAQGLSYYQAGPGTKILFKPGDLEHFLTRHQQNVKSDLAQSVDQVTQELWAKKKKRHYEHF